MESNFNLEYFQNQRRKKGIIQELIDLSKETDFEVFKQGIAPFFQNEEWRLLLDDVYDGQNILHLVCKSNTNLNIIKYLVEEKNCVLETRDKDDWTPLHFACQSNPNVEIIKYLIEQGCDLEAKNKDGRTPLHIACVQNENLEVIKYLVERGFNLDARSNDGSLPLHFACQSNPNVEIIKCLIEQGCDLEGRSNDGSTPFHIACLQNENIEVIKYLIERGCNLEARSNDGSLPLHFACQSNPNVEIIKCLIEQGCDLEGRSNDGSTPFHIACLQNENIEVIKYLIERGCNLEARSNDGSLSLHFACQNKVEIVKYLIELGFDPEAKNNDDMTPFHIAWGSNPRIIKYLVENRKCDLNSKDQEGNTRLFSALGYEPIDQGLSGTLYCITNLENYIDFTLTNSDNQNLLEFWLLLQFDEIGLQEIQQKIIISLRLKGLEFSEVVLEELSNQNRDDKEAIMKLLFAKPSDLIQWTGRKDNNFDLIPERDKKSLETFLLFAKTKGYMKTSIFSDCKSHEKKSNLLSAIMPETENTVYFTEEQVKGDGNCGFYTLGASRNQVVEALLQLKDNQNAREKLCHEIRTAFQSGELKPLNQNEWEQLFLDYTNKTEALNRKAAEIAREINPQVGNMELEGYLQYIKENGTKEQNEKIALYNLQAYQAENSLNSYCQRPEVFEYYVNAYRGTLWLGWESALLYGKQKNINIFVWQKGNEALELMGHCVGQEDGQVIHMLLTGGFTHFNLLVEANLPKNEKNNDQPVKSSKIQSRGLIIPKSLFFQSIAPHAISDKEVRNQRQALWIDYIREKYIPIFKSELGKNPDNEEVEKLFNDFLQQIKANGLMEKMIDNFHLQQLSQKASELNFNNTKN